MKYPTRDEIFNNDEDPIEALARMEREEAVSEAEGEDAPAEPEDFDTEDSGSESQEEGGDLKEEDAEEGPEVAGEGSEVEGQTEDLVEEPVLAAEQPGGFVDGVKKVRANGQEFEFTQEEINTQFDKVFGQAMDYTQKTQKLAPYRKMISALEEENVSQTDLNLALDALKGNKGALKELMEKGNIDAFDLDSVEGEAPYAANDYGKTEFQEEMQAISNEISKDEEYPITVDVIDKQWDDKSRDLLAGNPGMIQGLHQDIKSGVYDKVAPLAMKMKVLDGNSKSDLEYYMLAGEQAYPQQDAAAQPEAVVTKPTQDAGQRFDKASSEADKRRAASSTRARADRKGVIDYLDDDDEAFDKWHKDLMNSQ